MSRIISQPTPQAAEATLAITRVFDAPRRLVFQAWTRPERVKRWWGPKDFTTPVCEIDLRPGGVFRTCMRSPEGQEFWSQGVYHETAEPERLVFTDTFADENGNPVAPEYYGMSPDWPAEALITVTFAEQAGRTRLTVQHAPLPAGPERDRCEQGWSESLDKLADYLAEAARAQTRQDTMRAAAIDRFGGVEALTLHTLPVPEVGPNEVLIRVESAGVGQWDPFEREGGFATMLSIEPKFPYVLGSGVTIQSYDGMPDPQALEKLNRLIASGPFEAHIARTFPLERAADAQRALGSHYLGKLALRPGGTRANWQ